MLVVVSIASVCDVMTVINGSPSLTPTPFVMCTSQGLSSLDLKLTGLIKLIFILASSCLVMLLAYTI